MSESKREIQIKLLVNEMEQEQIQNNAAACNKTVSAYLRETALNMCILNIDQTCLTEHTQKILSLRNAIFDLIFYIRKSGNYTPPDLEYILSKMNEISALENDFIDNYSSTYWKMRKMTARTVRQIVNKRITKQ